MANSESTAVNDLIGMLGRKPMPRDSEEELVFGVAPIPPIAPPRPPRGTPYTGQPPMVRVSSVTAHAMPIPAIIADGTPRPRLPVGETRPAALPKHVRSVAIPAEPRRTSRPSGGLLDDNVTQPVERPAPGLVLSRLVLPMALFITAGVFIGGFVAFNGAGHHHETTTNQPVAAAIATPAPVLAPIATPLTEILLETQPAGATVMMVDRGTSTTLGTTPIRISADPGHEVDLVFTLEGHTTRVEHLDPLAHNRLAIALEGTAPVAEVVLPPTVAPVARHRVAVARAGSGVLMVSSKPPCAIFVDGKSTGLTTPQRSITLPAGSHQITLVNSEQKIKKTVGVQITTDHTTKLTRDLMKS